MKSKEIIFEWFKKWFDRYPELESFYFHIYPIREMNSEIFLIWFSYDNMGINGKHWETLNSNESDIVDDIWSTENMRDLHNKTIDFLKTELSFVDTNGYVCTVTRDEVKIEKEKI